PVYPRNSPRRLSAARKAARKAAKPRRAPRPPGEARPPQWYSVARSRTPCDPIPKEQPPNEDTEDNPDMAAVSARDPRRPHGRAPGSRADQRRRTAARGYAAVHRDRGGELPPALAHRLPAGRAHVDYGKSGGTVAGNSGRGKDGRDRHSRGRLRGAK